MLQRTIQLHAPIDVAGTLARVRRGPHDPSLSIRRDGTWRASLAPGGPATIRLVADAQRIEATGWGDGAEAALDAVPDLVGANDHVEGFVPSHPVVARLWREHGGLRVPRTRAVYETAVASILEQRVTRFEAHRSQHQLVTTWGRPAPGPTDLLLPPAPTVLAGAANYDLHVVGIEQDRADAVRRVAAGARQLDALADAPVSEGLARLLELPGVGRWTAAEVALVALGDPDAVPLGDPHLPADVTHALTGTAIDDDEAMLDALAPFAGHRGRVIMLLAAAGAHAPERGPRYAPRDLGEA